MSKKNNSSGNNIDRASYVSPNPIYAPIHGTRAGSSADKARNRTTPTGLEAGKGSSQSGPLVLIQFVESVTGGSADKCGSALSKTGEQEDVDYNELELDSDLSADNASWRKIVKNFAIKPSDMTLPKMRLHKLQDQVDFRDGYQMVKPATMNSWEQIQRAVS